MKPLLAVVAGLVLVVLDLRVGNGELQPDLAPDPVGWTVAALALGRLGPLHRWFRCGAVASALGAVVSLPLWPGVIALRGAEGWVGAVTGLIELVVVVAVLSGVAAVVPVRASGARSMRTTYVVASVVFTTLALGAQASVAMAVLALMAGLVNLLVLIGVLVLLASTSSHTPTQPDPAHSSR